MTEIVLAAEAGGLWANPIFASLVVGAPATYLGVRAMLSTERRDRVEAQAALVAAERSEARLLIDGYKGMVTELQEERDHLQQRLRECRAEVGRLSGGRRR